MTLGAVYRAGRGRLRRAGNESAAFDAGCLFRKAFGLDRQQRVLRAAEPAGPAQARRFFAMARERAAGRPLQYILGEWPFLGLVLEVGEGVLIPREETELLARTAAEMLAGEKAPLFADLCAGSGAVALGVASLVPGARAAALEKYPAALRYLKRNVARAGLAGVRAVEADVLDPAAAERMPALDGVFANPPYVRAGEIPGLQEEVRREPREALDGGPDGLRFYRAVARLWLPRLKPGGAAAVEVGDGQAGAVCRLFSEALEGISVRRDFSGVARVVAGRRRTASAGTARRGARQK
ncbi:MAG TPA: peptide chain release factor N(5)-glutamine methyltransferase [Ruminococcaceae bacterium]|jgi:release factor glutamine methyltransferase|nr:peptide chain release factor N(5)-glutamine methyltransferase [Oscillospiraceae bacterium]